jgi:hypothetical protein
MRVGLEQQRDVAVVLREMADLLQHGGKAEGSARARGEHHGEAVGFTRRPRSSERDIDLAPLPIRPCTRSLRRPASQPAGCRSISLLCCRIFRWCWRIRVTSCAASGQLGLALQQAAQARVTKM